MKNTYNAGGSWIWEGKKWNRTQEYIANHADSDEQFNFIWNTKGNDNLLYYSVSINKTVPFVIWVNVDDFHGLHTLAMAMSQFHKFLGQLDDTIKFDFCKGACWLSITAGDFTPGNVTKASLAHGSLSSGGIKHSQKADCLTVSSMDHCNCQCAHCNNGQCPFDLAKISRTRIDVFYNNMLQQWQGPKCCWSRLFRIMDTSNHFWTFSSHEVCGECLEDKQAAKESFPTLIVDTISRYITRV